MRRHGYQLSGHSAGRALSHEDNHLPESPARGKMLATDACIAPQRPPAWLTWTRSCARLVRNCTR